MPASHAVLQDHEGRWALRFERRLEQPPERVWSALTTEDELFDWHPTPFELEPAVGGRISFRRTPEGLEMPDGRVLEYDPPRLLAHTWGEDELRWELAAHEHGCVLRLTHIFDDRLKAARDAAGWDLCLDALAGSLAGVSRPQRGTGPSLPDGWSALNSQYQERFGIAAGEATPPPQL
jgi:uncharacterized protein YndB with AHSA1/START domain